MDFIDKIRKGAPDIFLTATIDLALFPTKTEILHEAFRAMSVGADQIYTARGPHIVEMLSKEDIPVMCHLGLVPRKSSWRGGLRAIGKNAEEAYKLYNDFKFYANSEPELINDFVILYDIEINMIHEPDKQIGFDKFKRRLLRLKESFENSNYVLNFVLTNSSMYKDILEDEEGNFYVYKLVSDSNDSYKSTKIMILKGKSYNKNLETLDADIKDLKGPPWVVKSQIHAGGRGAGYFKNSFNDKGGVQVVFDKDKVSSVAQSMMGNVLVTKQTGEIGKKVNRIFIEEGCDIDREFYLSLLVDRNNSKVMMMISAAGGMDIEEVAITNPEKIINVHFTTYKDISLDDSLLKKLDITKNQLDELTSIINKLLNAFTSIDASTIEINPLVLNNQGSFVVLDAKISLDDNALFRHPELAELKDLTEEDPLELQAAEHDMNYVKLDGSIGCMVNGAGLAMATMDIIKQFGEEPANFLDLGGTANKDRVIMGFKTIQSDPNVKSILINIFGGIIHCDMIANGIVEAVKELDFKLPLVVRFQGTNAKEGKDMINNSDLGLISIDDFTEAAKKVVELAKG